jgi:hypothetical protein
LNAISFLILSLLFFFPCSYPCFVGWYFLQWSRSVSGCQIVIFAIVRFRLSRSLWQTQFSCTCYVTGIGRGNFYNFHYISVFSSVSHLLRLTLIQLKKAASVSVALLNSPSSDTFDILFMTKVEEAIQYDSYIT